MKQVNDENRLIKQQLEDQRETSVKNKMLLDEYIRSITTHDDVVNKLRQTIDVLSQENQAQRIAIDSIRYPREHNWRKERSISPPNEGVSTGNNSSNPTHLINSRIANSNNPSTFGNSCTIEEHKIRKISPKFKETDNNNETALVKKESSRCKYCNRASGKEKSERESERVSQLLAMQHTLLEEIEQTKKELGELAKERGRESNLFEQNNIVNTASSGRQNKVTLSNFESLQEILDRADENDDLLFFVDNNNNTWQIIKRDEISLIEGSDEEEPSDNGGSPSIKIKDIQFPNKEAMEFFPEINPKEGNQ